MQRATAPRAARFRRQLESAGNGRWRQSDRLGGGVGRLAGVFFEPFKGLFGFAHG